MIFVSMLSSEMPCAEAARVKGGFRTYLWAETGLGKSQWWPKKRAHRADVAAAWILSLGT